MKDSSKSRKNITFSQNALLPKEEMLEVIREKKQLTIGVPLECENLENRVALAPHAVELLVSNGHTVYIQSTAGDSANFTDIEYSEAGGSITEDVKDIYNSDIVIKVAPPTQEEISLMRGSQILISSLLIGTQEPEYIKALIEKKITAIAFEYLRDKENKFCPVTESMSEISGAASILIAAEYLSNANRGKGEMLGGIAGISPTDVIVLGASTAGECAARTALGLGAVVRVFDHSIYKLRELQYKLGQPIYTSIIQPRVLHKALKIADVAIGALPFSEESRFKVSLDSITQMKPNSVIVDIGMDHGGCFETSEVTTLETPTFKKFNVIHYCVPNIPSRVSRTASYALSNIFGPLLIDIAEMGGLNHIISENVGFRNGVYLYNGILTKEAIGRKFGLPSRDIDLLLAAF
ncbi:MAG TPA: alanine dehydrogenase [Salinivirgaceae bacterium]|nr:alanine dehydrogenase [Salinivirgaceae bacterium]HQA75576.1 alanine dehydrogenase [Salinivirgaceae bacterium]